MTETEKTRAILHLCAEVERLREENQSIGMAAYELGRKSMADENAKLREQVERLHAEQVYWELGNCPGCPNVADLQEALEQNAKLRELAVLMCFVMYSVEHVTSWRFTGDGVTFDSDYFKSKLRESGIEVPE